MVCRQWPSDFFRLEKITFCFLHRWSSVQLWLVAIISPHFSHFSWFFLFSLQLRVRVHVLIGGKRREMGSFESPFRIKWAAHFFAEGYFKINLRPLLGILWPNFAIKFYKICLCACACMHACMYLCHVWILSSLINTKWRSFWYSFCDLFNYMSCSSKQHIEIDTRQSKSSKMSIRNGKPLRNASNSSNTGNIFSLFNHQMTFNSKYFY